MPAGGAWRYDADMTDAAPRLFWHRDLPPLDADPVDTHVLEAVSDRVAGSIDRHGEGWDACHASLMARAAERLLQELDRLGGDYAHVIDEHVDGRRDDATAESWLHGRFEYVLYRRSGA